MVTAYFLMASICATAARDDCRVERWSEAFTGANAGIACHLEREAYLDGERGLPPLRGNRLVRLTCETEQTPGETGQGEGK